MHIAESLQHAIATCKNIYTQQASLQPSQHKSR